MRFDLECYFEQTEKGCAPIGCTPWTCSTKRLSPAWLGTLKMCCAPGLAIRICAWASCLCGRGEQRCLLEDWNATASAYPRELCVQELFEAQARQSPEACAVTCAAKN